MSAHSSVEGLREFFQDYQRAFDSFDANRIAPFYHAPCITMRADGSIYCLQTQEEVHRFFQGVANTYRAEGFRSGSFIGFDATPIGGQSALATMDWEILREDGTVLRRWRQSYNVVRVDDRWKILVSTIHRE
jgi:ketosteroid isomerase-like protein